MAAALNPRVLVTGALGYVGGALVSCLRERGYDVGLVIRRQPTFETAWTAGLPALVWDMSTPANGGPARPYDLFIHAAGANDVDSADPRAALIGSALTTRHAIDFCGRNGIRRFLYLSTFQVYGASEGEVGDESPIRCLNDYALTHWMAEEYLRTAARNGVLDYVIARPTNVYGAPPDKRVDRWTLVPACFCKSAFETGKIVLRSSGRQHRNFIHLRTLADALTFLADSFDRSSGGTYNVAGPESTTIREVAHSAAGAYERIFQSPCELLVESDEPRTAAPLHVKTENLSRLGYQMPPAPTVADEINAIYTLLRR